MSPIRAAFYYPWFPGHWTEAGVDPATRYAPWPGFYDSSDEALIREHISAMEYARIQAGIVSWWGAGSEEDGRFPLLLEYARGTGVQWCPYYELAIGYPDDSGLKADLDHIFTSYAADPAYLKAPDGSGRPVLFVYGRAIPGCPRLELFMQANAGRFYVSVQAQPTPIVCPVQPDSWHQYNPSAAEAPVPGFSFSISPGFWKFNEATPRLARDPQRWAQNVADMVASGAEWQLLTTFNEWVEGSAIENAVDWLSADGQGVYLDALAAAS